MVARAPVVLVVMLVIMILVTAHRQLLDAMPGCNGGYPGEFLSVHRLPFDGSIGLC
jgi:hypothetical protein